MTFANDRPAYRLDSLNLVVGLVNALTPGMEGIDPLVPATTATERRALLDTVDGFHDPAYRDDDYDDLVTLAGELRTVFEWCDGGDLDRAAAQINQLLAAYRSAPRLMPDPDGHWRLHFHSADAGVLVGWGSGCAADLALVVGTGGGGRLGVCTADPCDRVYVDTSRNGNRRFCSTRCSNRVTAAAHRARRRAAT